ncbi:MAG TPA: SDR family oxidoreductase [Candidatus Saccharimonadales bacterium]|nr:SDR family oxidoreductase [Candidatus Saccharimonadales bacterium]
MKAFITGANSLVNKALLDRLVAMGYDVTAHYHTENGLTKELKAKYPKVRFLQADLSSKDEFLKLMEQSMDATYDVIVNAAVYYAEANNGKAQQDWDAWAKTFAVNTTAAGVVMAHADIAMNKGGVIVNISSTYGQKYMGDTQFTMYSASKAALDSLTMSFAKKWAPDIRVLGIAPGWVHSAWNKDMTQKEINGMIGPQLTHKFVEPEEIADLMEVAVKNGSINATTLVIDGGLGAPII